jgi:hypothetical protein
MKAATRESCGLRLSGSVASLLEDQLGLPVEPAYCVPFYLHVDEVENFATDAFSDILSEARKWKLSLLLAHQFLQQLPLSLRSAVIANVGSIVAFQTMGEDADVLARELGLKNADHLTQLARGEVCARHPTFGGPYHPRLLEPIVTNAKGRDAALKQNTLRNTYPRHAVMQRVDSFLNPRRSQPPAPLAKDPWPLSLRILRSAIFQALDEHGQMLTLPGRNQVVRAVDIQHVRKAFGQLRVADDEIVDDRVATREKAFRRAVESAQQRCLLGGLERDGTQWVWLDRERK